MALRRLTPADHRVMPWKNGGGTTTEIWREPGTGERHRFRVSIADVAADGPFSRFDGYDRHIMVIEGAGMVLDAGADGEATLRPLAPCAFPGEWNVQGRLLAGPVKDFNLMVDRAVARGSLEVLRVGTPRELAWSTGDVCMVHVLAGALRDAACGESLLLDAPHALVPAGEAVLAVATIVAK